MVILKPKEAGQVPAICLGIRPRVPHTIYVIFWIDTYFLFWV